MRLSAFNPEKGALHIQLGIGLNYDKSERKTRSYPKIDGSEQGPGQTWPPSGQNLGWCSQNPALCAASTARMGPTQPAARWNGP